MKTITIDDKKIEISDESYEAFKKQFVTKDKAILWKPEIGQPYHYISSAGCVAFSHWDNLYNESYYYDIGNIFKTKEEAQEALDTGWVAKRKAEVKILRFIAENDLEGSNEDDRYVMFYDPDDGIFRSAKARWVSRGDAIHFKSMSDAQKVIDAMTPELKILFGVK